MGDSLANSRTSCIGAAVINLTGLSSSELNLDNVGVDVDRPSCLKRESTDGDGGRNGTCFTGRGDNVSIVVGIEVVYLGSLKDWRGQTEWKN